MSAISKRIRVIGVPMDLGQSRRGVDMGPSAIRYAGLHRRLQQLGYSVEDLGNLYVSERDSFESAGSLAYLPAVVETCALVYEQGRIAAAEGFLPVFLGGDHSIALGTVGGVSHEQRTGLIWVDAHGDFNTLETSPSGNFHGMPLAALLGLGMTELVNLGRPGPKLLASEVVLIGVRSLDPGERHSLKESGITIYTMREVDERGIAAVASEAIDKLKHLPRLHVSLDMDCLDPNEAPGVGTPVPGGLSYREAHLLMESIADSGCVGSMCVVEVNPILDHRNHTAEIAVEMIASLLGQSIL